MNSFKPHVVRFANGEYGLRKRCWFGAWLFYRYGTWAVGVTERNKMSEDDARECYNYIERQKARKASLKDKGVPLPIPSPQYRGPGA